MTEKKKHFSEKLMSDYMRPLLSFNRKEVRFQNRFRIADYETNVDFF